MSTNDTTGGAAMAVGRGFGTRATLPVAILIAMIVAFLVHTLGPRADPREPPLIKPRIPFIGHIIGLMQHQANYHTRLRRLTNKPIATLPMLTGKMYAVWDPHLIASALRNKSLSTTPHTLDVAPIVTRLGAHTVELLRGPQGEPLLDRFMQHVIPGSLKGEHLQRLNTAALAVLASQLSDLARQGACERLPNTWLWLRTLIATATSKALYGKHDPFGGNAAVENALWVLERNLLKLTLNLPAALTPAGDRARKTLAAALMPYYAARHDEDPSASAFVRSRTAELRQVGIPTEDIARLETLLPFAALANTVPLLFWLICFIFSRSELTTKLREEVGGLIEKREGAVVTLLTGSVVEERCPQLMSCYRETLRQAVHQVSTRTAVQDTTVSDKNGRQYLIRAGNVVQLSIGTSHALDEYWGSDADEFKPDRFLGRKVDSDDEPGGVKAMRTALLPFGGGTHLCPGRHFAFAEMMAVIVTLLLGYEVEPLEGAEWKLPAFATRSLIDAVTKPANHGEGFGVRIRRRQGWEEAQWAYEM
ncbi:hypothetical protein MMYC01_204633 [Madurella mycetomatis]|uniref:Prostacyclin synthase n=1 Tax=Madurella mycetomatis TaxID=100816 RepID=A0A175VRI9_9PEZI|nr:hypothetical protein MMYC01_209574 [Madurella mycetomatis]KXX80400.1 hypothetical protein MMYC01_204633 [Madurella mycetomatis]